MLSSELLKDHRGIHPIQGPIPADPGVPIDRELDERSLDRESYEEPALLICCCQFPVQKICMSCNDNHSRQPSQYPHLLLPYAAFSYLQTPAAFEAFRNRTNPQQFLAHKKLQELLQDIGAIESRIFIEYEALLEELELFKYTQHQKIEKLRKDLTTAILEAMQEGREHLFDLDYASTTSLASEISRYEEGKSNPPLRITQWDVCIAEAQQAVRIMASLRLQVCRMGNKDESYCDHCNTPQERLYGVACLYCEACLFLIQRNCRDAIPIELTEFQKSNVLRYFPSVSPVPSRQQQGSVPPYEEVSPRVSGTTPISVFSQEEEKSPPNFLQFPIPQTSDSSSIQPPSKRHSPSKQGFLLLKDNGVYKKRIENDRYMDAEFICDIRLDINNTFSWAWLPDEQVVACGNTGAYKLSLSNPHPVEILPIQRRELPGIGVNPDSPESFYFFGGRCEGKVLSDCAYITEDRVLNGQMNEPRVGFHPVYHSSHFYIAGGNVSNNVEYFSIKDKSSTSIAVDVSISKCAFVVLEDHELVIIQSGAIITLEVSSYNTSSTPQPTAQEMDTPTAPVLCDGKVFVLTRDGSVHRVR